MALTVTAADVAPVEVFEQWTGPAVEVITAGQMVRLDTATGKAALSNGTTAAEARCRGIAINGASVAGITITAVKRGVIDVGDALGDLAFDQAVYLDNTDGAMGTAAGTVSLVVGRVVPIWGAATGTADKALHIDL